MSYFVEHPSREDRITDLTAKLVAIGVPPADAAKIALQLVARLKLREPCSVCRRKVCVCD